MVKGTGTHDPGLKDQLKLVVKEMQTLKLKVSLIKGTNNAECNSKFDTVFEALKKESAKIDKRSSMLIAMFQRLQTLEQAVTLHRSIINGMSDTLSKQSNLFHKLSGCEITIEKGKADEISQTEKASIEPVTSTEEVTKETHTTQASNAADQSADSAETIRINEQQAASKSNVQAIEKKTNPNSPNAKKRRAKRQARKASKKRNR